MSAVGEAWLFSLADAHIISKTSSFGKLGALLAAHWDSGRPGWLAWLAAVAAVAASSCGAPAQRGKSCARCSLPLSSLHRLPPGRIPCGSCTRALGAAAPAAHLSAARHQLQQAPRDCTSWLHLWQRASPPIPPSRRRCVHHQQQVAALAERVLVPRRPAGPGGQLGGRLRRRPGTCWMRLLWAAHGGGRPRAGEQARSRARGVGASSWRQCTNPTLAHQGCHTGLAGAPRLKFVRTLTSFTALGSPPS